MRHIKALRESKAVLHGHTFDIKVNGNGKFPCFIIGIGSLMAKTLSERIKGLLTLYSSNVYWIAKDRLDDPQKLTLDLIVDDVLSVIDQLKLDKPLLLAHSCHGIVALEAAKRKDANISGVILVASPPCWNPQMIAFAREHFDTHASPERKANDKKRQEKYAKLKKPGDSCINLNVYEADTARYWADFDVASDQLAELWNGIEVDDALALHFFDHLLPAHDLSKDMHKVKVPVFLAAGRHDYDSVPLELWKEFPHPKNFTILDCGMESGHWPNIECQEMFDTAVEKWLAKVQ